MVARFGGQTGSAVLFPDVGGAGLGTLASLGGDGMLVFLAELFDLQSGISGMPSTPASLLVCALRSRKCGAQATTWGHTLYSA